MALLLAMFWIAMPAQASGLTNGGYHDDGVDGNGNHYFEIYWYSGDPHVDCYPTSGTDGYISVDFHEAEEISGGGWVQAFDVTRSLAGQSGFSALPGTPVSIRAQPSDVLSRNVLTGPTGSMYNPGTICMASRW